MMSTADYALIVSILSLALAIGSFVWNVWSKWIYPKAKVRLTLNVMTSVGFEPEITRLCLGSTNYGPGKVRMHAAIVRLNRGWFRRLQPGFLTPLATFDAPANQPSNPFAGGMRGVIEEGEDFTVYFPWQELSFMADPIVDIGFVDTLGRKHWVKRKFVRKAHEQFGKDFPNGQSPTPLRKQRQAAKSRASE